MVGIIFAAIVSTCITAALIASQYTGRYYSDALKKLEEK